MEERQQKGDSGVVGRSRQQAPLQNEGVLVQGGGKLGLFWCSPGLLRGQENYHPPLLAYGYLLCPGRAALHEDNAGPRSSGYDVTLPILPGKRGYLEETPIRSAY